MSDRNCEEVPLPGEPDDEGMRTEPEPLLPLIWGTVRAVARVVMWASALALIVGAAVDGLVGDNYARASLELALVMVFLLFEIHEEVQR